jgi:DNA invertase Pin-like site-specific DNA recombinase
MTAPTAITSRPGHGSSRIAIYCRTAGPGDDPISIARQRAACQAWLRDNNLPTASVVCEHRPHAISPGAAARLAGVNLVVVAGVDRLGRDAATARAVIGGLVEAGVVIVTVDGNRADRPTMAMLTVLNRVDIDAVRTRLRGPGIGGATSPRTSGGVR